MKLARKEINAELKWGVGILSLYVLWALGWQFYRSMIKGSLIDPYNPTGNIRYELQSPLESGFLLGSDVYGRSLLEVLSSGLSYSLGMALIVSFACAAIGVVVGYISAKFPGLIRQVLETLTNLIFVFPSILIAIMIMSVTGQSFWGLVFSLVFTGWPAYARIARGESLRVLGLTYIESAKSIGVGEFRLFFTAVLPAILPVILVHFVLGLSGVIISEATLGFLGLGGSEFSWGAILSSSKTVLLEAPHMVILVSFSMAGLIIGLNLCGDGLRDYLDPHG